MPNGSGVRWAECLLIIGTGCRVQVFSLILDSSVGLSAGIQSAEDWVSETLCVRILHSAEEDNLSPFDSKIACLCQSIEINNNKYDITHRCTGTSESSRSVQCRHQSTTLVVLLGNFLVCQAPNIVTRIDSMLYRLYGLNFHKWHSVMQFLFVPLFTIFYSSSTTIAMTPKSVFIKKTDNGLSPGRHQVII